MEKNIRTLFLALNTISIEYVTGINRNNIKRVKELLPQIQQVSSWLLEGKGFCTEQKAHQELSGSLLQILADIVDALEREDRVLLHDAIDYGLLECLKLFVGQEDGTDDNL